MCISRQNSNTPRDDIPFEQPPKSGADKRKNNRHITVQHNYHDHSNDCAARNLGTPAAFEEMPVRGSAAAPFPIKLYEMLERVEKDGFGHVVSWQPHGRCFLVHNTGLFKELLPRYFNLTKIPSFQRQLNLYGFMRLTRGLDKGGYYHEMFLRGMPFLIRHIQRVKVKGTGVRARSNPEQEPDFWTMTWVGQDAAVAKSSHHITMVSAPNSSRSSGASVVSHDDDTDSSSTTTTSRRLESPPPLDQVTSYTTHRPQHVNVPLQVHQRTIVEEDTTPLPFIFEEEESSEDFLMMSGWGKPFYFLDSLPEVESTTPIKSMPLALAAPAPMYSSSSKPAPAPTAYSPAVSFGIMDDFAQDLDLDDLVHDIIAVDQAKDGNFLQLLERIILE